MFEESCVLYHYTHFLINKFQIKQKKLNLLTMVSKNYFQFELQNHGTGTCQGIDTISMQWNQKTQGTTERNRVPSIFFNHTIILNLNDKIMQKEPVRVLTPFQCDGTKNTGNYKEKEDTF